MLYFCAVKAVFIILYKMLLYIDICESMSIFGPVTISSVVIDHVTFLYQFVTRHAMIRCISKYPLVNRGDTTVIIGNVNNLDITELYREGPQKYLCGMLIGKDDNGIFKYNG